MMQKLAMPETVMQKVSTAVLGTHFSDLLDIFDSTTMKDDEVVKYADELGREKTAQFKQALSKTFDQNAINCINEVCFPEKKKEHPTSNSTAHTHTDISRNEPHFGSE